jgi:hypothetical protein
MTTHDGDLKADQTGAVSLVIAGAFGFRILIQSVVRPERCRRRGRGFYLPVSSRLTASFSSLSSTICSRVVLLMQYRDCAARLPEQADNGVRAGPRSTWCHRFGGRPAGRFGRYVRVLPSHCLDRRSVGYKRSLDAEPALLFPANGRDVIGDTFGLFESPRYL